LAAIQSPRAESIAAADDNVKAAEARLEALKKGPTPEQVRSAEIAVEQAKNALYGVQTQKDAACNHAGSATETPCQVAQRQSFAAEQAVKQAEQNLKVLKAGPTPEQLAQAQAAIDQAKAAAAAILGDPQPYDPVPWFWSDQYDVKLQIAGLTDGYDTIETIGDPASGKFAVEYRCRGRLVAVDAVNDARAHMTSRKRIAAETDAKAEAAQA
jgi:hypothetical protein